LGHAFNQGGERERANPAQDPRPRRAFTFGRRFRPVRFRPVRLTGWAAVAGTGAAALTLTAGAIGLPAIIRSPAGASPTSPARVPALSSQFVMLTGAGPPPPALFGAKVLRAASLSAPLHLQVFFQPTNPAVLNALATAVSTPGTAAYHHFLTVSQFAARFGASSDRVATIDKYLQGEGLSVGPLSANHLAQDVGGSVGSFEHAFATPLTNLRTRTGSVVVGSVLAPKLPARLASSVSYIEGLYPWVSQSNDLVRFPSHLLSGLSGRSGTNGLSGLRGLSAQQTSAGCGGLAGNGLTPSQLQRAYGLSGLYNSGYQGQGQTIGLIEYALADTRAVTTFEGCTGASLSVDYVPTSAPPRITNAEVAADIEVIAALAPKAAVVVYESNQQGTGLGPWDLAVSGSAPGGLPEVITSSWGSCEPDTGMGSSYYRTEESIFDEAATQGQTIFVASGDDGSEGCLDQTRSKRLAVDDPATTPGVTAVGGTASNKPNGPQYIWNSHTSNPLGCLGTGCAGNGASGGGASTVWARPSYQPASFAQSPECKLGLQGCREIPDVSALAGDPYSQFCSLSVCGSGEGWVGFGGTSLAAPSWGAAAILSAQFCSSKLGFLNPLLYSEPSALTGPISSGNNDLTGTNFGLYEASASGAYSMAGGLGYLGGVNLSTGALCGPPGPTASPGGTTPSTTTTSTAPGTTTTTTTGPGTTSTTTGTGTTAPGTTATTATGTGTSSTTSPGSPPTTLGAATPGAACVKPANEAVQGAAVSIAASSVGTAPGGTGAGAGGQCAGYWVVTRTGVVAAFGSAALYGSLQGTHLKAPIIGIAPTPDYGGYWLGASDGGVFAFGDAKFYGAMGESHLNAPIVGIAAAPQGGGYWLVASDGGVFAFGDAKFYGSMGGSHLNAPIVAIAAAPQGGGYWLVGSDGGVFGFGAAPYRGSMGKADLDSPIVGFTTAPHGSGYRMVDAHGNIFSFGATFYGSFGADPPAAPISAIAPSVDGKGYYLVDASGDVYAYGDAPYFGSAKS